MTTRPLSLLAGTACCCVLAVTVAGVPRASIAQHNDPNLLAFDNADGMMRTFNNRGAIRPSNAFFTSFGTNDRSCATCHSAEDAWTIRPVSVQRRFHDTQGTDPIFRSVDGSNCEAVTPGTLAESEAAYSLLLQRGLIRVGLDVPADAEFSIDAVRDPLGCSYASNDVSVYRRPLPVANMRFISAVMWDGRESRSSSTIEDDLMRQANSATRGHGEATRDLTEGEAREIVDFQLGLLMAQSRDRAAGSLLGHGAQGDPMPLMRQPFFIGINDPVGMNPSGDNFDPRAFTLFDAWARVREDPAGAGARARQAILRGQEIFNGKPIQLTGVAGLNEETFASGVTVPSSFSGTCTICHDTPNVGNHSVKAPLNIGLDAPAIAPYLPVYVLRRHDTGELVETTDPGRALITGRWADVGRFKGPTLRALSSRAPYFHNGSAMTLEAVADFYNTRFNIGLTQQEKADLVAFLKAL